MTDRTSRASQRSGDAKTRLATAQNPIVQDQLCRRIEDTGADIKALDEAIAQIAKQRGTLEERIHRLVTIPGIGKLTATTMLIDMPELGHLDSKKITALAGLAPMTQQSGKWQGKERIAGTCIYSAGDLHARPCSNPF